MPTCNYCGAHIEFRYIDGRCVPIHPDGGWHCGSWSTSTGLDSSYPSNSGTREWHEHEFTHPTTCPECGADVYFIRHNGGSVWVDELGWPWPKHACFDKPEQPTRTFSTWSLKSSRLTNPKLGIITRIRIDLQHAEPRLEIRLTDSSCVSLILRWTPPDSSLLGALVILSKEDSLLLHPDHAEIPFHSFTLLQSAPPEDGPSRMIYCFRCGTLHHKSNRCHLPRKSKHHNPKAKHIPPARPRPDPHELESQIRAAVDSVAKQAWASVAAIEPAGKRLKEAKQAALHLIHALPATIKGQIEHRFTSQKWAPLAAAAGNLLNPKPRL